MTDSEGNYDTDYDMECFKDDDSGSVDNLENRYYISKSIKEDDPESSIECFKKILDLEGCDKGKWGFKALKQMIKINFKLANYSEMINLYKRLFSYIKSSVGRDYSGKVIISIIDYISSSEKMELIQDLYEITLEALESTKSNSLWFKVILKLGKLYLNQGKFTELSKVLKELYNYFQDEDAFYDHKKETQLLEMYALEIQMYTARNEYKKLKKVYEKTLHIKTAMPNPYIRGIIGECGGKIRFREGYYEKAYGEFFEAFKNYDEMGTHEKITCLKYLVLVSTLMESKINLFESPEARPYKNNPEILFMTTLLNAYQEDNIKSFEKLLNANQNIAIDDPFLRELIEDLTKNIRKRVIIKMIEPYCKISIKCISYKLKIKCEEVKDILSYCILENSINGFIDERNEVLVLNQDAPEDASGDEP